MIYWLFLIWCFIIQMRGNPQCLRKTSTSSWTPICPSPLQSNCITPPPSVWKENYHAYGDYPRVLVKGSKTKLLRIRYLLFVLVAKFFTAEPLGEPLSLIFVSSLFHFYRKLNQMIFPIVWLPFNQIQFLKLWVSEVAPSCPTLCDPVDCSPTRLLRPWGFSRQEYSTGLPFPLLICNTNSIFLKPFFFSVLNIVLNNFFLTILKILSSI